ncbi:hypothetical protein ACHAQI_006438 [Fusarium lateritium]
MSELSFAILPSSYTRSDHSAELGLDELPSPPASAISRGKHQNEPRLKSSSSISKRRQSKLHRSSSRKATPSCTCCPSTQRLCGLADFAPSCEFCHVRETPKWREGPNGPRTLCNVCGLMYMKREEKARSFLLGREFSLDSTSRTSLGTHSTTPTSRKS